MAIGECISRCERHDLGAVASLPTRASLLEQGRTEGPVESSPELVRFGSGSTRFEIKAISMHRLNSCSGALPRESSCLLARMPQW